MTREQKLALIVGFSLILFVGVLISDHLSGARKAKIATVSQEPAAAPLNVASIPPPGPAPEAQAAPTRAADSSIQLIVGNQRPAEAGPQPATIAATPSAQPETSPVTPPSTIRTASLPDRALEDEIRRAEGQLVKGPDGVTTIHFPQAAATNNAPMTSPLPVSSRPMATSEGRIEPLKTHIVKPGETLFQITDRYYGNGNLWRNLAGFNGMDKAGTLKQGAQIRIPSKDVLLGKAVAGNPKQAPELRLIKPAPEMTRPARPKVDPIERGKPKIELASYTVHRGDTLGTISQKTLGTSRRWREIAELNNLDDEDSISTGTVLKIPAKRS